MKMKEYKEVDLGDGLTLKIENDNNVIIYGINANEEKTIISLKDGVIYIFSMFNILEEVYNLSEYNIIIKRILELKNDLYDGKKEYKKKYNEFKNYLKELCLK